MACEDIAYPYLSVIGQHKHVVTIGAGGICATVHVDANMVAVPIETIPPVDDMGRGTPGITPFCREYPESSPLTVTLTAPNTAEPGEVPFRLWKINGVEQPGNQTVVSFEVSDDCVSAMALYGGIITPISCPQIQMPDHVLVTAQTTSCQLICPPWICGSGCRHGTTCLERIWRDMGTSLSAFNPDGGANWFAEEIFRECPVGVSDPSLGLCLSDPTCIFRLPAPPDHPACRWPPIAFMPSWATKMGASFGIGCSCDFNTASVFWGAGFSKEGCNSRVSWNPGIGGGPPRWRCTVSGHLNFDIAVQSVPPRTAMHNGTQEDCDDTIRELAEPPFELPFVLTAWVPQLPSPPSHVMQCSGTITVMF